MCLESERCLDARCPDGELDLGSRVQVTIRDYGLGIRKWGLGFGDWGLGSTGFGVWSWIWGSRLKAEPCGIRGSGFV